MGADGGLLLKAFFAVIIFLIGAGGAYSARTMQASGRIELLTIGNCIAGGIFIGAGLIHTLADSASLYGQLMPGLDFPIWAATAGLSIVFLLWIDHRLGHASRGDQSSSFALLIILSLHSLIAGIALGLEAHTTQALAILIAILAHKGSAAFALGLQTGDKNYWRQMIGFALMTPIGVLFGATLVDSLTGDSGLYFEAVFDSVAAGTFLYVALCEILPSELKQAKNSTTLTASAVAGLLLMALLAIYT